MKALVVLAFELPEDGEAFLADILETINPTGLPFFGGGPAQVILDPAATQVKAWLDEEG